MMNDFVNIFLNNFNVFYLNLLSSGFSFEMIFISLFIFDILLFLIIKLLLDFRNYRRLL